MKTVVFTQDLGVPRKDIEKLLNQFGLIADWAIADGFRVAESKNVIAITTAHVPLTRERLEAFPNLKVVSMSFTGYDHVDKEYCIEKGIPVYNVPAYSTDSVAELAIGLALSLLREIPKGDREIRFGNWNENISGAELAGKVCGIVGTGSIGCRLAELLKAFRCGLLGWSRTEKPEFKALGGTYTDLDSLLANSDMVFVTVALNEGTKSLISNRQFDLMKETAYLINVARGPVVDRHAILDSIAKNKIKGVGLDVFDVEPLSMEDPLRRASNSVLTPHVAYRTREALERKATVTIENIFRGLNKESRNRVI